MNIATAHQSTPASETARPAFDVEKIRRDFPILDLRVHGKPLVYLDNAASAQKPREVIQAMAAFTETSYANIHRGVHELSQRATRAYETARERIRRFIGAGSADEIVFVRGTTEGINLVASTFGRKNIKAGDEIVISHMEHHSNIVPWQMLCEEKDAKLRVVPIDDDGVLMMEEYEKLLSERTKLVAITHVSNALGTINPVKKIIEIAHARRVPVLLDGAQSAPHMPVNVRDLDCDFYAFSGHKCCGPTGVGALYAKTEFLEAMPPYQGGGDMISYVSFEGTLYNKPPYKFEAGTPNITGAIGLAAAIDYLEHIGMNAIEDYESELLDHATALVREIPGVTIIGRAPEKAGVLSFVIDGAHPHDVGTILDREGIAIRAGHHCAQPVMDRFGIPATARASFAFYNTHAEVETLARAIVKVKGVFA